MNPLPSTKSQMANFFGCSVSQIEIQIQANINGLQRMLDKAILTGKKVNGYTEFQLRESIQKYKNLPL